MDLLLILLAPGALLEALRLRVGLYFGLGLLGVPTILQEFLISPTLPLARVRDSLTLNRLSLFFLRRFFCR